MHRPGQYGAVPNVVRAYHDSLSERCERNPDRWMGEYRPLVAESRGLIADMIHADAADVVMLENASAGVNTILRHIEPPLQRGDKVLYLSCAYGMTQSVLRFLEKSVGVELVAVDMVPTEFKSSDAVMEAVDAVVAEHGGAAAFAIGCISHLSSVPACVLPVARFCAALSGVPVLVDGAHAPGNIEIDVPALGAVAYTGNLHKWMYCPKGTAFLWASPAFQRRVVPPVLSGTQVFSEDGPNLASDFEYVGTRDYTNYAAVRMGVWAYAKSCFFASRLLWSKV
jgi:isopenicillin-N epimerase